MKMLLMKQWMNLNLKNNTNGYFRSSTTFQ